jgi:hypothetical protein
MDRRALVSLLMRYSLLLSLLLFPLVAQAQIGPRPNNYSPTPAPPLPENAQLKVFSLQYAEPETMGGVLSNLLDASKMTRMAIDKRTNSLIVAGDEKQLAVVEALLVRLDQPGAVQGRPQQKAETLQLRVVWVQDGIEGNMAEEPYVNSQVVEALLGLGFEKPVVVCQHFSTLALQNKTGNGRFQGECKFELPVECGGIPFQFSGQGRITSEPDEQYALDFNFTVRPTEAKTGSQLSGSVITPLSHYTVMGTTMVLPGDGADHRLSAFIVYLDKARTFGQEKAKDKKE